MNEPPSVPEEQHEHTVAEPGWPRTLLRLLGLRAEVRLPRRAGPGLLLALAVLCVGVWIGFDWLLFDEPVMFYPHLGVPAMACYALAVLALAAILALASRPQAPFAHALALVLAATPLVIVLRQAIDVWVPPAWIAPAGLTLALYLLVYGLRCSTSLCGRPQPRAILPAMLAVLAFRWAADTLYLDPSVWAALPADDESEFSEESWRDAERVLFEQSRRIDQAVGALAPPDATLPSIYFVGFAGMGEQRVFAEEIGLAARVIGERYDAGSRTLLLLNDRRDLERAPLASPTALRYALRALAAKMRPDQDILFLALSSHGSQQSLAVSNGVFMLQDLRADELAEALRDAGIAWRVIVISACHSGSFIDALRDPRTIVLTAAAADRTSFGCSDERELTYFGEAFWRDALPLSGSLREAFAEARAAIEQRERDEGIDASDPQAWFGAELELKLEALERAGAAPSG